MWCPQDAVKGPVEAYKAVRWRILKKKRKCITFLFPFHSYKIKTTKKPCSSRRAYMCKQEEA